MENTQEKYPNLISAEILADSLNQFGERITTMKLVFPRIILAEFNTHRMFNRNSASSRAIPFKKMVKMVQEQPFIPIAWQKDHKGMQGTEYLTDQIEIDSATGKWLNCMESNVKYATSLGEQDNVTKQIRNRLLEPFMYHTVLVTATEWDNFFKLRNPVYEYIEDGVKHTFNSKKDFIEYVPHAKDWDNLSFLLVNKGQAEIHIMDLAEKMWDAMNESTPKQLEVGQWHIPFGDNIKEHLLLESFGFLTPTEIEEIKVKIAVARCARLSYETLGDNPVIDYRKDIALHNTLLAVKHMSPFEHCAVVMENEEYYSHIKGNIETQIVNVFEERRTTPIDKDSNVFGWSRNLKGFKQYREIIEYGK